MIENVLRARGEHPDRPPEDVMRDAAAEVARPVLFAVAIIILVYVPILALQGVAGKMFVPMALTVILALSGSLVAHHDADAGAGGDLPRRPGRRRARDAPRPLDAAPPTRRCCDGPSVTPP